MKIILSWLLNLWHLWNLEESPYLEFIDSKKRFSKIFFPEQHQSESRTCSHSVVTAYRQMLITYVIIFIKKDIWVFLTSRYDGFNARALCLLPSSSRYPAKLTASSNEDTAFSTAFMTRLAWPYSALVFSSSVGSTSLNSGNNLW